MFLAIHHHLKEQDLGFTQACLLLILIRRGITPMEKLQKKLTLSQSRLSYLCSSLSKRGLIQLCTPEAHDRRRVWCSLTATGRPLAYQLNKLFTRETA